MAVIFVPGRWLGSLFVVTALVLAAGLIWHGSQSQAANSCGVSASVDNSGKLSVLEQEACPNDIQLSRDPGSGQIVVQNYPTDGDHVTAGDNCHVDNGGQGGSTGDIAECDGVTSIFVSAGAGNDIVAIQSGGPFGVPATIGATIFGLAGKDRLIGGAGSDVIFGDGLYGGASKDTLIGGGGRDALRGGGGVDRLKARDGRKDKLIDCGPGANSRESAVIDRGKDPVPTSC